VNKIILLCTCFLVFSRKNTVTERKLKQPAKETEDVHKHLLSMGIKKETKEIPEKTKSQESIIVSSDSSNNIPPSKPLSLYKPTILHKNTIINNHVVIPSLNKTKDHYKPLMSLAGKSMPVVPKRPEKLSFVSCIMNQQYRKNNYCKIYSNGKEEGFFYRIFFCIF
jgi:hypothetical protein